MNKEKIKTGIVFGVFDGFHEGHRYLLSEAAKIADSLTVVVPLDKTVVFLKGRLPRFSYEERIQKIKEFNPHATIVQADRKPGPWSALKGLSSFIVILGYDQQSIAREMEKMNVPTVFVQPHHPEKYKSSLLK